jgi:hypothetical protein
MSRKPLGDISTGDGRQLFRESDCGDAGGDDVDVLLQPTVNAATVSEISASRTLTALLSACSAIPSSGGRPAWASVRECHQKMSPLAVG